MEEKYMVNDILSSSKETLKTYQDVITESANTNLRQVLQEIWNSNETFQYDLFRVAQLKGYYVPASPATPNEINTVKSEFQN